MSPWTHRGNEMFGEVLNLLMLMSRGNVTLLQPKAGVFWATSIRGGFLGSLAGGAEPVKSLGVSQASD